MKMEKTEFGNKTDFIGSYNYKNVFVVIKIDESECKPGAMMSTLPREELQARCQ